MQEKTEKRETRKEPDRIQLETKLDQYIKTLDEPMGQISDLVDPFERGA